MYCMKALISSSSLPTEGYIDVIMETQNAHEIDFPFKTSGSHGGRGTFPPLVS